MLSIGDTVYWLSQAQHDADEGTFPLDISIQKERIEEIITSESGQTLYTDYGRHLKAEETFPSAEEALKALIEQCENLLLSPNTEEATFFALSD
ncbi:hypothetical protein Lbir_1978 [Legionella birminghamensis]|uniref:Uncharacterized protein n=1 Tax=Legionella birminghamensis TaxID=28083 RepID=A0A378JU98_9GAMM|nr:MULTISPECIES: hypothetical protein [Legionella]KTC69723.1 hypothetical protein Lbir_1978 [Legionella birminghamensis]SEG41393.1 hypothetical protein SAMN02746093_02864 [Legionella quinlivanii DSM 21216]STX60898.1 Uncharacterised protein [Legionella birminghamensis]